MKKYYSTLAIMAVTAMMAVAPSFAADTMQGKTTTMGTQTHEVGVMKGGYSILGTKLIGMEVENDKGENLGAVKDIMLDSTGRVRYVAVSYGGIMGLGDKMYAVPLQAFTFKRDKDMFFDDVVLRLNVTKEQLKDSKGFDDKSWPNLDDEAYRNELDTRYNIKRIK